MKILPHQNWGEQFEAEGTFTWSEQIKLIINCRDLNERATIIWDHVTCDANGDKLSSSPTAEPPLLSLFELFVGLRESGWSDVELKYELAALYAQFDKLSDNEKDCFVKAHYNNQLRRLYASPQTNTARICIEQQFLNTLFVSRRLSDQAAQAVINILPLPATTEEAVSNDVGSYLNVSWLSHMVRTLTDMPALRWCLAASLLLGGVAASSDSQSQITRKTSDAATLPPPVIGYCDMVNDRVTTATTGAIELIRAGQVDEAIKRLSVYTSEWPSLTANEAASIAEAVVNQLNICQSFLNHPYKTKTPDEIFAMQSEIIELLSVLNNGLKLGQLNPNQRVEWQQFYMVNDNPEQYRIVPSLHVSLLRFVCYLEDLPLYFNGWFDSHASEEKVNQQKILDYVNEIARQLVLRMGVDTLYQSIFEDWGIDGLEQLASLRATLLVRNIPQPLSTLLLVRMGSAKIVEALLSSDGTKEFQLFASHPDALEALIVGHVAYEKIYEGEHKPEVMQKLFDDIAQTVGMLSRETLKNSKALHALLALKGDVDGEVSLLSPDLFEKLIQLMPTETLRVVNAKGKTLFQVAVNTGLYEQAAIILNKIPSELSKKEVRRLTDDLLDDLTKTRPLLQSLFAGLLDNPSKVLFRTLLEHHSSEVFLRVSQRFSLIDFPIFVKRYMDAFLHNSPEKIHDLSTVQQQQLIILLMHSKTALPSFLDETLLMAMNLFMPRSSLYIGIKWRGSASPTFLTSQGTEQLLKEMTSSMTMLPDVVEQLLLDWLNFSPDLKSPHFLPALSWPSALFYVVIFAVAFLRFIQVRHRHREQNEAVQMQNNMIVILRLFLRQERQKTRELIEAAHSISGDHLKDESYQSLPSRFMFIQARIHNIIKNNELLSDSLKAWLQELSTTVEEIFSDARVKKEYLGSDMVVASDGWHYSRATFEELLKNVPHFFDDAGGARAIYDKQGVQTAEAFATLVEKLLDIVDKKPHLQRSVSLTSLHDSQSSLFKDREPPLPRSYSASNLCQAHAPG